MPSFMELLCTPFEVGRSNERLALGFKGGAVYIF